jgi:hypothetical protein
MDRGYQKAIFGGNVNGIEIIIIIYKFSKN